jgi:hypothetical protein
MPYMVKEENNVSLTTKDRTRMDIGLQTVRVERYTIQSSLINIWSENMRIVPVNFNSGLKAMLGHSKMIIVVKYIDTIRLAGRGSFHFKSVETKLNISSSISIIF